MKLSDTMARHLDQLPKHYDGTRTRIEEWVNVARYVELLLSDCADYLEPFADAEYVGDPPRARPNNAGRLVNAIRDVLGETP